MSIIKKLYKNGNLAINAPSILDIHYEVMMGSVAYGANQDKSDLDIHAFSTPKLEIMFPHLTGAIPGFGSSPAKAETFQMHNIIANEKNYDIVIYPLVKLFQLAADNNPNVLDMLWVPEHCILHMDQIGEYVRQNRKHFLHKGCFQKFRGYAYAQLKKLESSPRAELVELYGYDSKHLYHIIRLGLQCQQILQEGDMDISINGELLKAIRRGEWTLEYAKERFHQKLEELDKLYIESKLQYAPDMGFLRNMLMVCIEMKYGSIASMQNNSDGVAFRKLEEIRSIINR